jgi:hypothetical protein
VLGSAAYGQAIHVNAASPAAFPTGASWSSAFRKLEDALAIASSGQEVWVAKGT